MPGALQRRAQQPPDMGIVLDDQDLGGGCHAQELAAGGNPVERELALVKVAGKGEKRVEALRLAEAFRASVIDASTEHFIFEITGKLSKIEQFIALMQPLGLVEVSRTGLAAISRGAERM